MIHTFAAMALGVAARVAQPAGSTARACVGLAWAFAVAPNHALPAPLGHACHGSAHRDILLQASSIEGLHQTFKPKLLGIEAL